MNVFIKEVEELRQVRNELKASNEMQKHGNYYLYSHKRKDHIFEKGKINYRRYNICATE